MHVINERISIKATHSLDRRRLSLAHTTDKRHLDQVLDKECSIGKHANLCCNLIEQSTRVNVGREQRLGRWIEWSHRLESTERNLEQGRDRGHSERRQQQDRKDKVQEDLDHSRDILSRARVMGLESGGDWLAGSQVNHPRELKPK